MLHIIQNNFYSNDSIFWEQNIKKWIVKIVYINKYVPLYVMSSLIMLNYYHQYLHYTKNTYFKFIN